ncbi:MAG: hypothetical protein M1536_09185 [Firmicutes bacterium]|nr:hypothetical protein [Bacillota bacterium]
MKKILVATILAVFALGLFGGCEKKIEGNFLPLAVGNSWEFVSNTNDANGNPISARVRISGKVKVGNDDCYEADTYYNVGGAGQLLTKEYFAVRPDGVYSCKKDDFDAKKNAFSENLAIPPQKVLPSELKIGEKWNWKGKIGDLELEANTEVQGQDKVTVFGKEYDCVIVYTEATTKGSDYLTSKKWYAPGVGYVKEEAVIGKLVIMDMKDFNVQK